MQRFLLIFTSVAVFFAEGVSAQTANPSTSPQPLNLITVHAGQCECGKSIGSFDALYQNRTINIGFGFESTLVLKEDSLLRDSYQWICPSHDNIMADCLLTEAEVTVAGTWESTNLFVAKVIHLPKMCLEGIRTVQALVEARKKGLPPWDSARATTARPRDLRHAGSLGDRNKPRLRVCKWAALSRWLLYWGTR
jgi:hypothetical protein